MSSNQCEIDEARLNLAVLPLGTVYPQLLIVADGRGRPQRRNASRV